MEPSSRWIVVAAALCGCAWAACSTAAACGSYVRRLFEMDAHVPCLVYNLATPHECEAMIRDAEAAGLRRSTVVHDTEPVSTDRTSSHAFLSPGDSEAAARVCDRVSTMLGIPTSHFEKVQVARYHTGEKYEAHYDATRKGSDTNSQVDLPRMYTVLLYLNEGFEGGHTAFPNCGADVTPQQGMGVLWRNIDDTGKVLRSSFHAGRPVQHGTKYIGTIWIHGTPIARP